MELAFLQLATTFIHLRSKIRLTEQYDDSTKPKWDFLPTCHASRLRESIRAACKKGSAHHKMPDFQSDRADGLPRAWGLCSDSALIRLKGAVVSVTLFMVLQSQLLLLSWSRSTDALRMRRITARFFVKLRASNLCIRSSGSTHPGSVLAPRLLCSTLLSAKESLGNDYRSVARVHRWPRAITEDHSNRRHADVLRVYFPHVSIVRRCSPWCTKTQGIPHTRCNPHLLQRWHGPDAGDSDGFR